MCLRNQNLDIGSYDQIRVQNSTSAKKPSTPSTAIRRKEQKLGSAKFCIQQNKTIGKESTESREGYLATTPIEG